MKIIDPHIHLFDLSLGDYQWLKPENPPLWSDKSIINKNFSESDIALNSQQNTLCGFVHIEAGFNNQSPWKEIEWLEETCKRPFKSVACIDITLSPDSFIKQIKTLIGYKSLVGCRHILDNDATEILSHKNASINLQALSDHQLIFELQMPLSNIKAIHLLGNILKEASNLTVIINHAGFPPSIINEQGSEKEKSTEFDNWLTGLTCLSKFNNCVIKCSGWEMEDRNYDILWCKKVINLCVNKFSINRVMLSSNFPLCLFSKEFSEIWTSYTELPFNKQQLEQLCYDNAKRLYKF